MRSQRQAARDALSKIRSIQEWENLSENSTRFKQLASSIDDELRKEIEQKHVDPGDVDMSQADSSEEDSSNEQQQDSFVVSTDDEACDEDDKDFALVQDDLLESDSMHSEDNSCEDAESDESQASLQSEASEQSREQSVDLSHVHAANLTAFEHQLQSVDALCPDEAVTDFCNTVFLGT